MHVEHLIWTESYPKYISNSWHRTGHLSFAVTMSFLRKPSKIDIKKKLPESYLALADLLRVAADEFEKEATLCAR